MSTAEYRGPLCGDPTCKICPVQHALDAWHELQEREARDMVRAMLGLPREDKQ